MIRSGKVVALVGGLNVTPTGGLINYIGVTANTTGVGKYKDSPFSTFQASVKPSLAEVVADKVIVPKAVAAQLTLSLLP